MKKPTDFAILAIGLYVFHQIILPVILFDYVSFIDSLKYFTGAQVLVTEDYYRGVQKSSTLSLGGSSIWPWWGPWSL